MNISNNTPNNKLNKTRGRRKISPENKRKFRTTLVANDIEWEKIKNAAKNEKCSINTYLIKKAIDNISTFDSFLVDKNQTSLFGEK